MLVVFALVALMLAGVDAVLWLFGLSLMTIGWSPLLLAALGVVLLSLEAMPKAGDL